MAAPGHCTPSVGVRATSSSARKSTSTSFQTVGSASTAQSLPRPHHSSKAAQVKFGPPKGKKRDNMPDVSVVKEGASHAMGKAQAGDPGPAGAVCRSRGPTPPTSRPSTPTPMTTTDASELPDSAAPAPETTFGLSTSDEDYTSPPAAALIRRATSAQPRLSTPTAVTPSAVRAQSVMSSITVQPAVLKVRCRDVAAGPSTEMTFNAALFAAATSPAVPTPSAGTIGQQSISCMPADDVGPSTPHTAKAPHPSTANSALVLHPPNTAANTTPDAFSAKYTSRTQDSPPTQNANVDSPAPSGQINTVRAPQHLTGSIAVPDLEQDAQAEVQKGNRKRKGTADNLPPAKKRKTSGKGAIPSTSSDTDTAVNGEDAQPKWVVMALSVLQSTPLGPEWDVLLRNWLQFEQNEGFEGSTKLGCRHRPPIISDWIRYARKPNFRSEIKNLSNFIREFDAWWRVLQPAWRHDDDTDLLRRDGEDWECLRCSGVNGLLSVLAALFFWGCHVRESVTFKSRWSEALEDVSYAVSKLL